jgi:MFS family permease
MADDLIDPTLAPGETEAAKTARGGYLVGVTLVAFAAWTFVSLDTAIPGLVLTGVHHDLHLSLSTLEYLLGVFNFVTFACPVIFGRYLDRVGRRKIFQLSLLGTGVFGGLTAFVGSVWQFVAVRVLASTSFGLVEPAVNTVVSEEAPPRRRGVLMGFVQAGFPLGAALAGSLASLILPGHGWRAMFLLAFAPVLVMVAASLFMRESRRFQQMRSTVNRLDIEHRPGWRMLFRRGLARQTLVASAFGLCINGGIGLVLGVVTAYLVHVHHLALGDAAFLFGLSNWAALVSQLFVGWLADRLPAKWIMVIGSFLGAASLVLLALPHLSYATAAVSLLGFGFFGNGTFGCYPRYTTESFPTELRGTGTSFVLGTSFLSLSFMPIIGGALIESSFPRVLPGIAAALVLLGGVAMIAGRNIPPRHDLEETSPSQLPAATA